MSQLSDEELIARCASGDRCGMDVLVTRYHGKLLDLALRSLGDRETAADVAQTAFVRVFQSAASFRSQSTFRTWLYAITLNLIREELRKRKRRGESLFTEMIGGDDCLPEPGGESESAEDVALRNIESLTLWRAVDRLPEQRRSAVILRFRLGLSYDEIADVMGARAGTVKSWVHHSLKSLRETLGSLSQDWERVG